MPPGTQLLLQHKPHWAKGEALKRTSHSRGCCSVLREVVLGEQAGSGSRRWLEVSTFFSPDRSKQNSDYCLPLIDLLRAFFKLLKGCVRPLPVPNCWQSAVNNGHWADCHSYSFDSQLLSRQALWVVPYAAAAAALPASHRSFRNTKTHAEGMEEHDNMLRGFRSKFSWDSFTAMLPLGSRNKQGLDIYNTGNGGAHKTSELRRLQLESFQQEKLAGDGKRGVQTGLCGVLAELL